MSKEISPLPWVVEGHGAELCIESGIYTVADMRAHSPDNVARQAANAAFIVKACNSHDKLKWALGEALDLIDQLDGRDNSCDRRADISDLRAALAAAGAQ